MKQFKFPNTFNYKGLVYKKVKNEAERDIIEKDRNNIFEQFSESTITKKPTLGYINFHLYYRKAQVKIDPLIIDEFDTMLLGFLVKNNVY